MTENQEQPLNQEEYIHSLENALIFMCQTYKENFDTLFKLMKEEGNEAFWKYSTIQGSPNVFAVEALSKLKFQQPVHGFPCIRKEIERKRSNQGE